jgi:hypothetical protein
MFRTKRCVKVNGVADQLEISWCELTFDASLKAEAAHKSQDNAQSTRRCEGPMRVQPVIPNSYAEHCQLP